jgi:hypothetical protein
MAYMNIKYLPCVFEVYVLDVSNLPEDLLYENILTKLHVYNTRYYFDTMKFVNFLMNSWKKTNFARKGYV